MKYTFFQVSRNKNEFQRLKSTADNLVQQLYYQRKERSSKELVSVYHKFSLSNSFLYNKGWSSKDLQNKSEVYKGKKK